MPNYRLERINEETARALAMIIREVKDPRVSGSFVSITGAEVSRDLKFAKVYWSALGAGGEDEKEIVRGLRSSAGFIRRRLAAELNLRVTPELIFVADRSAANGAHISQVLKKIVPNGTGGEDDEKKD
ncbi:MAG: 30S ribosome-binding factor RbfA [Clostridia bacterium]|nr:30S ribosome-binding factor RbfA [Clostridia bacterium]